MSKRADNGKKEKRAIDFRIGPISTRSEALMVYFVVFIVHLDQHVRY